MSPHPESNLPLPAAAAPDALAGRLDIALVVAEGCVAQVDVTSTRPQIAARLLRGKPAALAVAAVPRLYALCAGAHAVAAQRALQAAAGSEADAGQQVRFTRQLDAEIARESLWRMLVDWPQQLGEQADPQALAGLRSGRLHHLVERHVLGAPASDWLAETDGAGIDAWLNRRATVAARYLAHLAQHPAAHSAAGDRPSAAADAGRAAVPLLPSLADARVAASIGAALCADAHFARRPLWQGQPAETGALARLWTQRVGPLGGARATGSASSPGARWIARLVELARIAAGAPAPKPMHGGLALSAPGGQRGGLGWAESARGVLAHCVQIDAADGEPRVTDYRVLAPTEWNFHPRGALAAALVGSAAGSPDELRQRARRVIESLDPCVPWSLRVREEAVVA